MEIKVGDKIGMIRKIYLSDGKEIWELYECPIQKIVQNSKGTKVYSKGFYSIDADEISTNTVVCETNNCILVNDVVLITKNVREKCERWINWANENPQKAVSLLAMSLFG